MFRTLVASAVLAAPLVVTASDPTPVHPFNGKDLKGWKLKGDEKKNKWMAGLVEVDAAKPAEFVMKAVGLVDPKAPEFRDTLYLVNAKGGGVDISTEQKFGDCIIELEFMVPKGSNSGIYVMGEYEVQILDSYGKPDEKLGQGDVGALYSAAAPKVNASKKPGEWQKFFIIFQAPKFQDGKKVANAKFREVALNGTKLHKDVEMKGPTPGGLTGKEAPTGPLMFQGDHGPVALRNIKIIQVEIKD